LINFGHLIQEDRLMASVKKNKKAVKPAKRTRAAQRPLGKKVADWQLKPVKGPIERVGAIMLGDKPATVIGDDIAVGRLAPEFWAHANDWSVVHPLTADSGKVLVLAAVPSLSTNVCDKETRTFNEKAAALGDDIRVYVISADLPPTQKLWCGNAGVERVQTLSDHADTNFGVAYGTLIKERRYHRRAVFVIDRSGVVVYSVYMPALGAEPNYDEVLAAARAAV
jgi:thiol peroxidase